MWSEWFVWTPSMKEGKWVSIFQGFSLISWVGIGNTPYQVKPWVE